MPGVPADVLEAPEAGLVVYGMFLEGCGWDAAAAELVESAPKVLFTEAPMIWLKPMRTEQFAEFPHYACPVYRTAERKGALPPVCRTAVPGLVVALSATVPPPPSSTHTLSLSGLEPFCMPC